MTTDVQHPKPQTYNNANKSVSKHILTYLGSIVAILIPLLMYSGAAWVDDQIEQKMGNYATKTEAMNIQRQLMTNQIDYYQEQIYEIQDKKVDGLSSSSDNKKLFRLQNKISILRTKERDF